VTQPKTVSVSWKAIVAVVMLGMSLIAVTAVSLHRTFSSPNDDKNERIKKKVNALQPRWHNRASSTRRCHRHIKKALLRPPLGL
jgi:hypothetical protein